MVPAYYTLPSHTPLTLARPALVSRDHSLFSTSLSSDEVPRLPMLPSPHPPGCYQGYLYAGPWCNHLLQPYHGLPSGQDGLGVTEHSSGSSIHALRMLRSHGLGSPQLFEVARSTTLASML